MNDFFIKKKKIGQEVQEPKKNFSKKKKKPKQLKKERVLYEHKRKELKKKGKKWKKRQGVKDLTHKSQARKFQ